MLLSFLLVSGISSFTNFFNSKEAYQGLSGLTLAVGLFGLLVNSSNQASTEASGVYQLFIGIIFSLVIIWSLRQLSAGRQITLKQSFYNSMFPFVQFILVFLVIMIQMIPLLVGSVVLQTVLHNSIAITVIEKSLFFGLFILLAAWTFYMVSSSIFALYIATLPDMTPLRALRSAKDLVRRRRFQIILRLLGLPIITGIIFLLIFLPLVMIAPFLAVSLYILISSLMLYIFHAYIYSLYRAML